jgi:hypothetical protein
MITVYRMALGVVVAGGVLILYVVNPAASSIYPPCPLHSLTGLYCPGCGSLRAMHQLLHGEIWAAVRLSPLMVASIPVLCLLLAFRNRPYHPWVCWCALGVLLAYGILRNIPLWPFSCLTPHP